MQAARQLQGQHSDYAGQQLAVTSVQGTSASAWVAVSCAVLCYGVLMPSPGRKFLTKINANIGNSAVSSSIEEVRGLCDCRLFTLSITRPDSPTIVVFKEKL
jgi:hypothetical protein